MPNAAVNRRRQGASTITDPAYMQNRVPNSQRYLVVGLVGLGLPLTVTIRVTRVSAMVSARFSVH